ncbi:MAG: methyl-accepting chemotaxis protein [Lachnospiraceae bacterium]|nr:methyl-accepting chemotaxis protein [Lachnospiraceae bacterium]
MKTRRLSLRTKITLVIALSSIICFCVFGVISYQRVSTELIEQIRAEALHIAEIAASDLDGDRFANITSEEDDDFTYVYDTLVKYRESEVVEYIYTMKQVEPGQTVFVVDTDPEEPAEVDEEYEWLDVFETVYGGEGAWDDELTVDEWGTFISGYAPIFGSSGDVVGLVGVDVSLGEMEQDVAVVGALIMILIGIFCVIFILISLVIGYSLRRKLNTLYAKVHDLNGGEADLTKKININSGDELETIAGEFNTFIDHIHDQMKSAAGTSDIVAENSESMESLVEECRGGLSGIASELHTLSESMRNTTNDTAAIVEGINGSRDLVGRAFENANSKAEEANRISSDAGEMEKEIARKAEHATQMAATLKERLEEAAEKCQAVHEIEELADKILKVSSTTKMLSLNASIEAARAGDAGRGFAIIAGDVQDLSSQITDLVELIRQTNEQVIISVEGLIENVNVTTGFLSDDVLPDYREFSKMGADYSTNMSGMSDALREINENLEKVNTSMDMIRDKADSINTVISDSSHQIDTVATGSIELEGNMNDLTERAIKNNDEARSLNRNISEYKL